MENTSPLSWSEFAKVDMRIGTIIKAEVFKEVKNPAYKLLIDFGDLGIKKSSAQITKIYQDPKELVGRQVVAVVNFPPKQIANMMSECLVIAGVGEENNIVLLQPERTMPNGTKIG
ncbi:tRNA-binding protein [Wenyingzhuangia sp. IMCC45467]